MVRLYLSSFQLGYPPEEGAVAVPPWVGPGALVVGFDEARRIRWESWCRNLEATKVLCGVSSC
jgi:hypothetical protein